MKKRRGKRLVAYIIAFAMIFSMGMTELSPIAEAAQYTILETDVSAPSTGCTMFGVYGTYYVDAQNALNRINEIRKEACEAGNVPDPRNSNRMLTASDYVPIKWSTDLERIARIRAVEGGLCFGFVGSGHNRLNGKGLSTVKYNGVSTYAEVLAYNWNKGNLVSGINQWYGEKSDWVNKNSSAVTGHYTSMIDPGNTYVGLGDFYTTASGYPNTLAGEFNSSSESLSQSALSGHTDIMQKVEVKDAYINKYYLKGEATQYLGETQTLTPMVHLVNGSETLDLWVIDTVTYTSSDTTVASVTADGVVTAKKAGTTTITCKKGSNALCTFNLTVSCNHNKVLQSTVQPTCQTTGENIYKCSKCGMTIKESIEKAPHSYVYGTADSTGKATGVCSFCNATITIVPPTSMSLYWRNSESSDSSYYSYIPTENPIGSNILCWVYDINGDSGYQDVMFESSDNSVIEAPTTSVSSGTVKFKVKKAGIVTISVYPKYNPAIKKSYTIRTGADGSVDISNAVVTLAKTSISCGTSTSAVAPTVTYNGIKLTSGTDYTVSHSTSGTTGTCKITGKGIFSKSVEKTYTITHTYVNDPTVTGALKSNATCTKKATYYKSCSNCEKLSTETFESGSLAAHSYTVQHVDTAHLASAATCTSPATYYYECSRCGKTGTDVFSYGDKLPHQFTAKIVSNTTKKSDATYDSPAVYYYSCSQCGAVSGSSTFTYGTTVPRPTVIPQVDVSYKTHIQTYGDSQPAMSNGWMAGTSGEAKRLENIWVRVSGNANLGVQYTTHCQTYGWLPWSANGEKNGTSGEAKRLEAIKIRLTGADKDNYDIYYRVHAQSFGWLAWAKNGEPSGTAGYGKRLEGIQIVVVKKGESAPGQSYANVNPSSVNTRAYVALQNGSIQIPGDAYNANIMYKTHVQSFGWQTWKTNGQMSGTSGKAKRLEGINIKLSNAPYSGGVRYTTHVQSYGWQGNENDPNTWRKDGEMSGTSGQAKRLEAIRISLYGEMAEHYDIYYRVHAQSFGWLSWAKNGEASGTAGLAKRLEGIQIILVPKGSPEPGRTYDNITATNTVSFIRR